MFIFPHLIISLLEVVKEVDATNGNCLSYRKEKCGLGLILNSIHVRMDSIFTNDC